MAVISQAPKHEGLRTDVLGSNGKHDQSRQHDERFAETGLKRKSRTYTATREITTQRAQGSSGRHDHARKRAEQKEVKHALKSGRLEALF